MLKLLLICHKQRDHKNGTHSTASKKRKNLYNTVAAAVESP